MRQLVLLVALCLSPLAMAATGQITVRGRLAHDLTVISGESVTGSIIVDNETNEPQQARVYSTDYRFFADGTNDYGTAGVMPRSNAGWLRYSPTTMTIPPNGSVTVNYTIDIPDSVANDPTSGTYWSMLMIEAIAAGSAESTLGNDNEQERTVGFSQVTRYGVQVATHIEANSEKLIEFEAVQLVADEEGGTLFKVDVINTGTLMIRPEVYLRVFNENGNEFGPFNGIQYRLYPGTSVRQRIELEDLPAGAYQVLLVVDAGEDAVFGGQFQINL